MNFYGPSPPPQLHRPQHQPMYPHAQSHVHSHQNSTPLHERTPFQTFSPPLQQAPPQNHQQQQQFTGYPTPTDQLLVTLLMTQSAEFAALRGRIGALEAEVVRLSGAAGPSERVQRARFEWEEALKRSSASASASGSPLVVPSTLGAEAVGKGHSVFLADQMGKLEGNSPLQTWRVKMEQDQQQQQSQRAPEFPAGVFPEIGVKGKIAGSIKQTPLLSNREVWHDARTATATTNRQDETQLVSSATSTMVTTTASQNQETESEEWVTTLSSINVTRSRMGSMRPQADSQQAWGDTASSSHKTSYSQKLLEGDYTFGVSRPALVSNLSSPVNGDRTKPAQSKPIKTIMASTSKTKLPSNSTITPQQQQRSSTSTLYNIASTATTLMFWPITAPVSLAYSATKITTNLIRSTAQTLTDQVFYGGDPQSSGSMATQTYRSPKTHIQSWPASVIARLLVYVVEAEMRREKLQMWSLRREVMLMMESMGGGFGSLADQEKRRKKQEKMEKLQRVSPEKILWRLRGVCRAFSLGVGCVLTEMEGKGMLETRWKPISSSISRSVGRAATTLPRRMQVSFRILNGKTDTSKIFIQGCVDVTLELPATETRWRDGTQAFTAMRMPSGALNETSVMVYCKRPSTHDKAGWLGGLNNQAENSKSDVKNDDSEKVLIELTAKAIHDNEEPGLEAIGVFELQNANSGANDEIKCVLIATSPQKVQNNSCKTLALEASLKLTHIETSQNSAGTVDDSDEEDQVLKDDESEGVFSRVIRHSRVMTLLFSNNKSISSPSSSLSLYRLQVAAVNVPTIALIDFV